MLFDKAMKIIKFVALFFSFIFLFYFQTKAITYYSYTNGGSSGEWNNANTWTTDPSGGTLTGSAVPGNNDDVVILNGYVVNLTANVLSTGLGITINNGGTLDLHTYQFQAAISSLNGGGTLRIRAGYFPIVTSNSFCNNAAALVEYVDFSGSLPVSINYPNIVLVNNTSEDYTITFTNTSAYNLNILGNFTTLNNSTGSLTVNFGSQSGNTINATLQGSMNIGSGTKVGVGAFNAVHKMTFLGNLINNGTINLSNNIQYASNTKGVMNTTFSGAKNNSIICNGVTNLNTLTVDKGVGSDNILSVTATDPAYFKLFSNGQLIYLEAGTLRLGNNINLNRLNGGGNYDLGGSSKSPMLWIDGAAVDANKSALVVYGKFRITAGSFTSIGGEGGVIREEGQYIIEGGTVTLEKFRPSTTANTHRGSFVMTGGVFNATGTGSSVNYARFSHPYPEQVFIMSGGTINVSNPQSGGLGANGGIHIGVKSSNYAVTGGTFNAILSGSAPLYSIASTAPFYNLNISRTGGPTTVTLDGIGSLAGSTLTAQPLTVLNNFTIDGANNPVFNPGNLDVTLKGDFNINSGATYLASANNTIFSGNGDQVFNNSVTVSAEMSKMTVDKASGTLTLAGASPSFKITNALTLLDGVLNDGGKTVNVIGTVFNAAIHTGTGNITLNGTATQTLSGDGKGIFGNLILNNPSSPGALLTCNQTISGTLTLAGTGAGIFDIDIYQLALTSTSSGSLTTTGSDFSVSKMIRTSGRQSDGGIKRNFGNLSPFLYACGTSSAYTPVTIKFNTAPATYGDITVRPVDSRHQFVKEGNTNNLKFYWKVTSSGITGVGTNGVSHTYQYSDALVTPSGDDKSYIPARYHSTAWNVINNTGQVNENSNQIFFSNVDYVDGDYTAGIFTAFGTVKVFYSKRDGNWNNILPGSTPWSNISHTGPDANTIPGPNDQVFIGDGAGNNHTITVTANGQKAGSLIISSGSVLDVTTTTGHNFGALPNAQVSGNGRLRISSALPTAEFPAGDFGNFIRTSGGTVEYYSTGNQVFTIPTVSASPSLLPLITYRHLVLSSNGRFIRMPDHDETIYGNLTIQGQATTALAQLNAESSKSLTIKGNLIVNMGTLEYQNNRAQTVNVEGNVSIGPEGVFNISGTGAPVNNQLVIKGNLVNNGIFDMAYNSSLQCDVTFIGAQDASITGTGSVTDFNNLIVSKGNSLNPVLNVNASSFSLSGSPTPLQLNFGTFRLTSDQTIVISNGQNFNIPATGRLSANGGTMQLLGPSGTNLLLGGTLEVLKGSIYIGTSAHDNSIEYASTGQPTISVSGGNLYVQSQIRRPTSSVQGALTYIQSGNSKVHVAVSNAPSDTRGVLEILNTGSFFSMTGGTLSLAKSNNSTTIADLYLYPTTSNITGGTVEIGTNISSQTLDISTLSPLYNFTVSGTSNTARLETNPLILRGSLNIHPGCVFNANALNVSIAGNFSNVNADNAHGVLAGGFRAGSATQTTTFNGTGNNQSILGTTGNLSNFANLVINNTFTNGSVTLQPNSAIRINNTLTLLNGTFADGGNTITAAASVYNGATHASSGAGQLLLAGASVQAISGNGNGKFGNLTLNNASGTQLNADQEITGNLTFTKGSLWIRNYHLYLSNNGLSTIIGADASKHIITTGQNSDGGVTKTFPGSVTHGTFTYPIGVAGKFTPATYTITTGSAGGNINIIPVNAKHPSATGPGTSYLNYYWNVTNKGVDLLSLSHTYTYSPVDIRGTESEFRDARYIGGLWEIGATAGNPNPTLHAVTFANTDLTGGYTAGEPTAFVNSIIYKSVASGNWESDLSVWDFDPPGTNIGPPSGSIVIINEGHTITVNNDSKNPSSLEVRGRLHLGATTGHNFGTITAPGGGEKTIQLQSSTFPGGNFTAFVAPNGGTIEYNGAVNLPIQATYNHLLFTGSGTKTLANVDLVLNGHLTINQGVVTNAVNRNIVLVNNTADFTNHGIFNVGNGGLTVGRNLINSGIGTILNVGNGTENINVAGDFVNASGAVYNMGTGSLIVGGNLNNEATFTGNTGEISISGNLNNTEGSFTSGTGDIQVEGSFTNNATFAAGSGTIVIQADFINGGTYHNGSGILTINNNFLNTSGANFQGNTGTINLTGNWDNSAAALFNPQTSSVNFNSNTGKTLSGKTVFHNFTKSGSGVLTLSNNVEINNLLTLSNGKIVTGPHTVYLKNTSTQPITGYAVNSFIDGGLAISYPNDAGTSRLFPVGKGNTYRPVNILQNAASNAAVVKVEMINTAPSGDYEGTLSGISGARYYKIDLEEGIMNAPLIELSFNTNGTTDEPVSIPGNLKVARATSPNGPWTDEGGSGVFSPAAPAGYLTSLATTIQFPTYFSLAYTEISLPINLLSFTGQLIDQIVHFQWSTASEYQNDYFTIERSTEGKEFDSLFIVEGAGDSHVLLKYLAQDPMPLTGKSFYRLKQTDFNGAFSYSKIIGIHNEGNIQFKIAPNPSKGDRLILQVEGAKQGQEFKISIFDLRGNRLYKKNLIALESFENIEIVPYNTLPAGVYLVRINTGLRSVTEKIIVAP